MSSADNSRGFIPLNIALLTVSDTRTEADDRSGAILRDRVTAAGHHVAEQRILADRQQTLEDQLRAWIADPNVDVAAVSRPG